MGRERPEDRLQRRRSRKASWKTDSYVGGWVKDRKEERRPRKGALGSRNSVNKARRQETVEHGQVS